MKKIKNGERLFYCFNSNVIIGCTIHNIDDYIDIELDEVFKDEKRMKFQKSALGKWLFFEKSHTNLSTVELYPIYGDYGSERFKEINEIKSNPDTLKGIISSKIVPQYLKFFFQKIIGFKNTTSIYEKFVNEENTFISIAMDKISRMQRKGGRLRNKVWSNCIFIFHDNSVKPYEICESVLEEYKEKYPYLFIRSYVYFVFINALNDKQKFCDIGSLAPKTSEYKIWCFNSKYELKEETRRTNLFDIKLSDNEVIDDYVYLASPLDEMNRIQDTNSDVIDCVKAFTGELPIIDQTKELIDKICEELRENENAKILLEGPARSGKTIIAATLLHIYSDSKMLLMNSYFYKALIDGLRSLSTFTPEEVETLISSPKVDEAYKMDVEKILDNILKNLRYAKQSELHYIRRTSEYLIDNIEKFMLFDIDENEMPKFSFLINKLLDLREYLIKSTTDTDLFIKYGMDKLEKIKDEITEISDETEELKAFRKLIINALQELPKESAQRFFHHDLSESKGCWIQRGNPTMGKMWSEKYKPQLIICDEFQRLGVIKEIIGGNYTGANELDKFDEIKNIICNSKQLILTGDDFQKLNSKYDQGVERIKEVVREEGAKLIQLSIPHTVGVPSEIGLLIKYFTHSKNVDMREINTVWKAKKHFDIMFICNQNDRFVAEFDNDKSKKKHFAIPIDSTWIKNDISIVINTSFREPIEKVIKPRTFPYFCNEEIMRNYYLSAYELISREVESIYVHIPDFGELNTEQEKWFNYHLYVLFTRATRKLVVNFADKNVYKEMKEKVEVLNNDFITEMVELVD